VAALLTATAAKERDTRLARLADGEVTAAIASFDEIVCRYRGVAPTQRTAFHTGHSDRYGVLELPARRVAQVVVVDADDARRVSDAVTATNTALTSATAAFTSEDVGRTVIGDGFPLGVTIATRSSATAVVLSAATTAAATGVVATIGTPVLVDQIDEAPGRIHIGHRGRFTVAFRHGMTSTPSLLLDACTEYVLCTLQARSSGVSRNTLSIATEAGTTRYSTPDWHAGRPTGWLDVDRLLNSLPDERVGLA
jgi:hypothetical protein